MNIAELKKLAASPLSLEARVLYAIGIKPQSLNGRIKPYNMSNLAFVISGNWQKGVNIFALTTTVFLLCAMYVAVVLISAHG